MPTPVYATIGDVRATIDQETLLGLADRDGDGIVDTAVVNMALLWGEGQIDSALAARYTVPLATSHSTTPNAVRQICLDFTRWRLLKGTPQPANYAENLVEAWTADYNNSRSLLNGWAKGPGKIPSITETGSLPVISIGMAGDDVEKTATLTRTNVGGAVIDTDEAGSMDVW